MSTIYRIFILGGLLLVSHLIKADTLPTTPTQWQLLAPGLEYAETALPGSAIALGQLHAFRIDLSKYTVDFVFATDNDQAAASVKELAQTKQALIGINGGFFDPQATPLGLRIQHNQQRSLIKPISWWGIFYLNNNRPYIVSQSQFKPNQQISFAVQAGPRLLVNGRIPPLKDGQSQRSLLCITAKKQLIIAATQYTLISTTQLARLLRRSAKQGGLGCTDALNLDGGSSTQLYAHIGEFDLDISNHHDVSEAIIVTPRPAA